MSVCIIAKMSYFMTENRQLTKKPGFAELGNVCKNTVIVQTQNYQRKWFSKSSQG